MDIKTEVPDAELESIQLKVEFIEEHQDPQISSSEVSLFTFKKEVEEILTMESSGIAEDKNKSSEGNLSARGVNTEGQRSSGAPLGSADSLPSDGNISNSSVILEINEPGSMAATGELVPVSDRHVSSPKPCSCSPQSTSILDRLDRIERILTQLKETVAENNILLKDQRIRKTPARAAPVSLPATTREELDEILQSADLVPRLISGKEATLTKTAASMLKMILSRNLAIKFSMTGLGAKRKKTKLKFDNSPACNLIETALSRIPAFQHASRRTVKTAIQKALKETFSGCEKKLYVASETDGYTSTEYVSSVEGCPRRINITASLLPRCNAMSAPESSLASSVPELTSDIVNIKKSLQVITKKVDMALVMLQEERINRESTQQQQLARESGIPPSADTDEELEVLLQNPGLPAALNALEGRSSVDTVRRLIRRLMTKKLAASFSWSGLGAHRKATKKSFREHQAGKCCYDAWKVIHPRLAVNNFSSAVVTVLKSVPDWDGGRSRSTAMRNITGDVLGSATALAGPSSATSASFQEEEEA